MSINSMLQEKKFEIESQDSRVGIAKGYGLESRGSTPRMRISFLFSTAPGAHTACYSKGTGKFFSGSNAAGA
jgi:hypothetical protein